MADQYKIVRFYQNHKRRTIKTGLTLKEVQEHCADKETSSTTAIGAVARARTKRLGEWFDGYTKIS